MTNAIEIRNLSKFYGRSRGVDDISLDVAEGDFFGFIGPNGAGKSTTIRILLNLIFPSSGSARIFGLDAVRESKKARQHIGYVPSDANLYDRMKVIDFLEYGASYYGRNDNGERIMELASLLDLDTGRNIPELSTGNKKKVNIIQALAHRPPLLILDEPTTGLDPLIQARLFSLLTEANRQGTTVFFSSHILSEVQALCRSVAILREGRVIRTGTIAGLRDSQLKKISVVFSDESAAGSFSISGMKDVRANGPKSRVFMYSGDINRLTEKLAACPLDNLSIEEPPLEEVFLHYYN